VDHQVATGRGEHVALRYLNEQGDERSQTYRQLLAEVTRVSAALRPGHRPRRPGHAYTPTCRGDVTMRPWSASRHPSVVLRVRRPGLSDRIVASGSAVFTADFTYRKGKRVPPADRRRLAAAVHRSAMYRLSGRRARRTPAVT
jgi:acyl-coenzyme A synthetase/AMP-(fatty) acid ligase